MTKRVSVPARRAAAAILALPGAGCFAWFAALLLNGKCIFNIFDLAGMSGLVGLPLGAAALLLASTLPRETDKRLVSRLFFGAALAFYTIALAYLLFLSGWRSNGMNRALPFDEYFRAATNFVPFGTVAQYMRALAEERVSFRIVFDNLAGNLALFAPMGLLLPCLFRRQRKFGWFLLTMLAALLLVEGGQLFLRVGSCDVDDLLLNLAGALLFFGLWKLPPLRGLWARLHLLP